MAASWTSHLHRQGIQARGCQAYVTLESPSSQGTFSLLHFQPWASLILCIHKAMPACAYRDVATYAPSQSCPCRQCRRIQQRRPDGRRTRCARTSSIEGPIGWSTLCRGQSPWRWAFLWGSLAALPPGQRLSFGRSSRSPLCSGTQIGSLLQFSRWLCVGIGAARLPLRTIGPGLKCQLS